MSGTTSVPTITFTNNGFVAPLESAIVTGLDADYNAALGGNLNTDPRTPQGQLIASTAAIIGDANNQELLLFNNVDPSYASGRFQDGICRIYFLTRNAAQSTVLQILCGGLGGVVIPVGALIQDAGGNIYACTQKGTIDPVAGTVTLPFAAQLTGPLPVPGASAVSIYQAIPNWNTVSCSSGVVGNAVETRAAFELRRQQSVANNAVGVLPSVQGNVLKVNGVLSAYTTENFTGSSVVTGGVTLNPHSLYVCVAGGAASDIAEAIWVKKNPGCNYNGSTSFTVTDSNSGYLFPYPTYVVSWTTAINTPTAFTVQIANSSMVPSDAETQIGMAVYNSFIGADNGPRATIGALLLNSRYMANIAALGPWAQVLSIQLGSNQFPSCSFTAAIAATTMTVSAVANATFTGTGSGTNLTTSAVTGTITPGWTISGAGVPSGTTIVSQTSGTPGGAGVYVTSQATTSSGASITAIGALAVGQNVYGTNVASGTEITAQLTGSPGSTGTYTVAVSQTVGSEAMTSVASNQNFFQMNINAFPTLSPLDVNVVLVNA